MEGIPADKDGGVWTNDWSENPWRYMKGAPTVVEMLLPCGRVAKISAHRHDDVRHYPWHAKPEEHTIYVCAKIERKQYLMHAVLNDQWLTRDHINHDGLDNRDENIRDGGNGINALNKHLKVDGVVRVHTGYCWRADWTGIDRKPARKNFYWTKGDADSEASQRAAAAQYRREMAEATLAHAITTQAQDHGTA